MARPRKKADNDVIKASAAIQISGKISLLQRRAWNVLLANAYDELPTKDRHTIHVADLIRILEFNSDRDEYLKGALRALTSCNVEWDILDKDGEPEWGVAALLAGARITRGICTYTFEPMLREKLHNPRIYARLCLSLQNKFESKYALTLWELCTDYLGSKRDYGETPWLDIDTFRDLMGIGANEYRAFRDVNKRVIIQAMAEINRISDFRVTVAYRHKGRKVTGLKFKMCRVVMLPEPASVQDVLFPELDDTPPLVKELRDAGLATPDALDIWQQGFKFVDDTARPADSGADTEAAFLHYVREKIHLLQRRQASGKVENSTGFLRMALKKNFANPEFAQAQNRAAATAAQQGRKEAEKLRQKLAAQLAALQTAQDEALDDTFRHMALESPELLETALPDICAENAYYRQNYDHNRSVLDNYRGSVGLRGVMNLYLERHDPARIQAVKARYVEEIAALEQHIAALPAG